MPEEDDTGKLFHRYKKGDPETLSLLIARLYERFKCLARQMLRGYPILRTEVETGDVLNQAMKRLLDALQTVVPESLLHFRNLAAQRIRWELIDLARKVRARGPGRVADPDTVLSQQPDRSGEPSNLAELAEFHEKVGQLPEKLLQVVNLHIYHGLSLEETARELGISLKTAARRLQKARLLLGGFIPQRYKP